jgi:aminoglycoside phosphotransferase (APT) family kinase protein
VPIPPQRDAGTSRGALSRWLRDKVGADGDVRVGEFRGPGSTGFSNETLIADLAYERRGERVEESVVVRVAPTGHVLFPDAVFDAQYEVLRALAAHTPVSVPDVRWYEPDPSVLGAPFFVMAEVPGNAPPDNPPYHVAGWLHDVSPQVRERIWFGCIDTIAEVHAVDWRALGLRHLERPALGEPGLEQQLAYYTGFLESVEAREPVPLARRSLEWLLAHPPEPEELVLCWGDARPGNILYDEQGHRLAVLDWEMTGLGAPSMDVAWALLLDRHHSEGCRVPRLEGFPTTEQTVARYEERTGRTLAALDYYEVFAAFRFCVIMAKLALIFKDWDLLPPGDRMAQDNTISQLTETILAERGTAPVST